jgi:hypothetical protein
MRVSCRPAAICMIARGEAVTRAKARSFAEQIHTQSVHRIPH